MGNKIENKKISPRIKAILLITLLCIILTAVIFPADDVYFYSGVQKTNKLLYMLFGLPCDALISNILIINSPEITSENKAASIFIYAALFFLLKYYKALLLFIVPYSLSSVLLMKYIAVHHTGLFTLFFIFIFWCALSVNTKTMKPLYKKCVCVILLIPVLIQLNWTFTASAREYNLNYWYSRETAQYIKEHHLDKYRIMSAWGGADENNFSVLQMGIPVHVNPYFHKNIFYNFNTFYPNKEYVVMKENSEYENKRAIDEWKKHELPDIFIGGPQLLQLVYDKNSTQDKDYCLLHVVKNYQIFKNYAVFLAVPIYAREDIIEEIINDGNNEEKIHC